MKMKKITWLRNEMVISKSRWRHYKNVIKREKSLATLGLQRVQRGGRCSRNDFNIWSFFNKLYYHSCRPIFCSALPYTNTCPIFYRVLLRTSIYNIFYRVILYLISFFVSFSTTRSRGMNIYIEDSGKWILTMQAFMIRKTLRAIFNFIPLYTTFQFNFWP